MSGRSVTESVTAWGSRCTALHLQTCACQKCVVMHSSVPVFYFGCLQGGHVLVWVWLWLWLSLWLWVLVWV